MENMEREHHGKNKRKLWRDQITDQKWEEILLYIYLFETGESGYRSLKVRKRSTVA